MIIRFDRIHFGGPFNAKPIIDRALRKSHVSTAKLKLYSYMQVLRVYQNLSARGCPRGKAPKCKFGTPYYLGDYKS